MRPEAAQREVASQQDAPLLSYDGRKGVALVFYIDDDDTANMAERLARLRGVSQQDAVKLALKAEIDRAMQQKPLRDRFAALRLEFLLPPSTGQQADKAFFDGLSGDL